MDDILKKKTQSSLSYAKVYGAFTQKEAFSLLFQFIYWFNQKLC